MNPNPNLSALMTVSAAWCENQNKTKSSQSQGYVRVRFHANPNLSALMTVSAAWCENHYAAHVALPASPVPYQNPPPLALNINKIGLPESG